MRNLVFFAADVHLGLSVRDPREREDRFVNFLRDIPRERTSALYLLGDIWDFWYEYRDVVPKEGVRVVSELLQLMDSGVEVFFFSGNHDIWCYSYFESLGMHKCTQPCDVEIGGRSFCLGHGDALGGCAPSYSFMLGVFHNRVLQKLFSSLHPWLAFRIALHWSRSSRRSHEPYRFRGEDEPLYHFALERSSISKVDFFVFGHFHDLVDVTLPTGSRLLVLKDWMEGGQPCAVFDSSTGELVNCSDYRP